MALYIGPCWAKMSCFGPGYRASAYMANYTYVGVQKLLIALGSRPVAVLSAHVCAQWIAT